MTTMTATIKCGNCKGTHGTVSEVRACYGVVKGHDGLPRVGTPNGPIAIPDKATEKQVDFIVRLWNERYPEAVTATPEFIRTTVATTKKQASATIEYLLSQPKPEPKPAPSPASRYPTDKAPEGMHKIGDEIFKVQKAVHGSGHLYAKRLVAGEGYGSKARFEYAPGVLRTLSTDTLMTLDEAKAWGALYGTCCVCGRTLTNEDSIEAGIGPICAQKF